ncbi:MAG: hypothetical protein PSN36_01905 [Gammaproteobacteria bacterium]|nr:hypothetical protein [Gammaproteobacteria bacterium]
MVDTKQNDIETDNQFSDKDIGTAYVFLNELKINNQLRDEWNKALELTNGDKIKADKKVEYLDNFIANNGFDVGAEVVLHVLKTPWWERYKKDSASNQASDRFVQMILQDPKLFRNWSKIIAKGAVDGSLDDANKLLQTLGYKCNAMQVQNSFTKMRKHNVAYWTGIYGRTRLVDSAGQETKKGTPSLIVYGQEHVSIGPDKIFDFSYKNGTLSWPLVPEDDEKYPFPNPHSGSITFSQISNPKKENGYVGPCFFGLLVFGDGANEEQQAYSYSGQIGDAVPNNNRPAMPHSIQAKKPLIENMMHYIGGIVTVGFGLMLVVGVGQAIVSKTSWYQKRERRLKRESEELDKQERKELNKEFETKQEKIIDSLQEEVDSSGSPKDRQAIEEHIEEIKTQQEEQENEQEKQDTANDENNSTEEESWGDSLEEVVG